MYLFELTIIVTSLFAFPAFQASGQALSVLFGSNNPER